MCTCYWNLKLKFCDFAWVISYSDEHMIVLGV